MAVSDALALTVPALLAGVGLYGVLTGTDVFSALTAGALDGLKTVVRIFPALVALLAAASDIIGTYGPDSRIGRTAAVMLGSTETTFYVLAVYFGACGVRRSRWAIPAAIAADLTGFLAAAALVRWIWGA